MSVSSSIDDWNIIDSDHQTKSNKLDIIIQYLKKNNLENVYLKKLDTLTKKVNSLEETQKLILEKLEKIENHISPQNSEDLEIGTSSDSEINFSNELTETQNIHRISNNIWRNNMTTGQNLGLKYLTTPNLSIKHLKYPLDCEKCKKCNKIKNKII